MQELCLAPVRVPRGVRRPSSLLGSGSPFSGSSSVSPGRGEGFRGLRKENDGGVRCFGESVSCTRSLTCVIGDGGGSGGGSGGGGMKKSYSFDGGDFFGGSGSLKRGSLGLSGLDDSDIFRGLAVESYCPSPGLMSPVLNTVETAGAGVSGVEDDAGIGGLDSQSFSGVYDGDMAMQRGVSDGNTLTGTSSFVSICDLDSGAEDGLEPTRAYSQSSSYEGAMFEEGFFGSLCDLSGAATGGLGGNPGASFDSDGVVTQGTRSAPVTPYNRSRRRRYPSIPALDLDDGGDVVPGSEANGFGRATSCFGRLGGLGGSPSLKSGIDCNFFARVAGGSSIAPRVQPLLSRVASSGSLGSRGSGRRVSNKISSADVFGEEVYEAEAVFGVETGDQEAVLREDVKFLMRGWDKLRDHVIACLAGYRAGRLVFGSSGFRRAYWTKRSSSCSALDSVSCVVHGDALSLNESLDSAKTRVAFSRWREPCVHRGVVRHIEGCAKWLCGDKGSVDAFVQRFVLSSKTGMHINDVVTGKFVVD